MYVFHDRGFRTCRVGPDTSAEHPAGDLRGVQSENAHCETVAGLANLCARFDGHPAEPKQPVLFIIPNVEITIDAH